jgi:segregation and condensation protein A
LVNLLKIKFKDLSYQIILPQFEGPFDLLLFFIERDELNIHDIPIHKITKEFLEYIHKLEQLNIEVASEFILVASTLMRIKAKMLLPRKDLDEAGNEIDPRKELVERLLEYKQYKEIIESLRTLEDQRTLQHKRGNAAEESKNLLQQFHYEGDLEEISLFKLVKTFQKVIDRYKYQSEKIEHRVQVYAYTIEDEKITVRENILRAGRQAFQELFQGCENRMHAIFRFLAVLEMIQQQLLSLDVGDGYNNFWVSA